MWCDVIYCAVLYCTVLWCDVMWCTMLLFDAWHFRSGLSRGEAVHGRCYQPVCASRGEDEVRTLMGLPYRLSHPCPCPRPWPHVRPSPRPCSFACARSSVEIRYYSDRVWRIDKGMDDVMLVHCAVIILRRSLCHFYPPSLFNFCRCKYIRRQLMWTKWEYWSAYGCEGYLRTGGLTSRDDSLPPSFSQLLMSNMIFFDSFYMRI